MCRAHNGNLFGDEPQVRARDVFDRANQVLEERHGIENALGTEGDLLSGGLTDQIRRASRRRPLA